MAVGKTGTNINLEKLGIRFGDINVVYKGKLHNSYNELEAKNYMKNTNIDIDVNISSGTKNFTAYTMDLTKK